jgi:hypothetical protein
MARKIDTIPPFAWKIWQNESIAVTHFKEDMETF